ncbi:MAG: T9SS type A sorting domain-containing protein [Saprospiraceae bacterium]|nr:T9SS type A sorting domain-containing protein [Saprospiraceae bacterium]
MKKICTSICACLIAALVIAQPKLELIPDSIDASFESALDDEFEEFFVNMKVVNISEEQIRLRWLLSYPGNDCPSAWRVSIADTNGSYPFTITSNVVFGGIPNSPIILNPLDTGFMVLHVRPSPTAGCCTIQLRYSELQGANGEIILDSTFVHICVSDSTVSSTYAEHLTAPVAVPNPTNGIFKLNGQIAAKEIWVFNGLGVPILKSTYQTGKPYDLSMFPNGLYSVCARSETGELRHILKLLKQAGNP